MVLSSEFLNYLYLLVEKVSEYDHHNHTLQTNPQHRKDDPQNTNGHKTPGIQIKKASLCEYDQEIALLQLLTNPQHREYELLDIYSSKISKRQ